ncbi:MAG: hypothetical protein WCI63_04070 [bacterium]
MKGINSYNYYLLQTMATMRPVRSIPKVDYSWMDVQPDNVWVDPDFIPCEESNEEEDDEWVEEPDVSKTHTDTMWTWITDVMSARGQRKAKKQIDYSDMEFSEEDAPASYRRARGYDREKKRVTWRNIQQTVLDGDSDYCPSDDEVHH